MDPHAHTAWHEVDKEGGFIVLSDEEEELQEVVQEERPQASDAKDVQEEQEQGKPVPHHEDMLTGEVHCTNIELRTSKVLNSLMAQVISGHHGTNQHGPFGARGGSRSQPCKYPG